MASPNTNLADRLARTADPALSVDVYSAADFGPLTARPDGVMAATLIEGATYIIHNQFVVPPFLVPKFLAPGTFSFITFMSGFTSGFQNMLVDSTAGAQFWGRNISAIHIRFAGFIDVSNAGAGNGSTLLNLTGGNGNLSVFAGTTYAIAQFKDIGNLVDCGLFYNNLSQTVNNESGFTLRITPKNALEGQSHSLGGIRFIESAANPDRRRPIITFIGDTPETAISANLVSLGKAANSFIQIDSGTPEGNYSIIGNAYKSTVTSGEFFRPTEVEAITGNAADNIAITSFSDSTADPGVDTTVNFGTVVDFVRGQVILIGNEAAYDGLRTIVRVADDQMSFDIAVVFSTSGGGDLFQTVHTVADCKFARDETVTITDEPIYNGTLQVTSRTDTTFTLPQLFLTTETATATSTGKDETFTGVVCLGNGAQEDSVRKGGVGPKHFDIFEIGDLPAAILAPDGNMRVPLVESAKYLVHETFVWPLLLVPEQTVFDDFEPIDFLGARTAIRMEYDNTSVPIFWGRNIGSLRFDSVGQRDVSNAGAGHGVTLFDLVGGSGFSLLGMSFLPAEKFKRIATLVDVALQFDPHAVSDNQEGYIVRNNPTALFPSNLAHFISGARFTQPNALGTTAPMLFFQGAPINSVINGNSVDQQSGDAFIAIDAGSATSEYVISSIAYAGAASGDFFKAVDATTITAFANNDVVITSFADSTVDPGVDTTVNFATIQPFTRGQFILIADEAAYDGLRQIQRVADDQMSFDIAVVFSTAGAGTLKRTTVTAASHGSVEGETQVITASSFHDGTSEILTVSSDRNSFDIPVAFGGADTGTTTTTSKDQKSIGVSVSNCGAQPDSLTIGSALAKDNATATTINTINVWEDLNLNASAVAGSNIERFTLTSTTTGELRFDNSAFSGFANLVVTMSSSGGAQEFEIRVVKNGAVLTDDIVQGSSIGSDGVNISLNVPVTGVVNDLFRAQVRNIAGTTNIVIEQFSIIVA